MRGHCRLGLAALMVLALIAPVLVLMPYAPGARAFSGIEVSLERPEFAGINETVACVMTISGGPGDPGGNFSYVASVVGDNTTGASINPASAASQPSGVFKFNVTMPVFAPETLTIRVNATSENRGNTASDTLQKDFKIKVVVAILLTATVRNTGPLPVQNVTARFFADGTLLHTAVFNISANSTQTLTYNWTFLKLKSGKHIVTVTVDDPNNIVEFSDGNNVVTREIWYGRQSNVAGAILTGGVVVLAVLVFLLWMQKPMRRPKK